MRKIIIYYVLITGLIACSIPSNKTKHKRNNICESSIDSIKVSYYNIYFESPLARKYNDIMKAKRPSFEKVYIGNTRDYHVKYTGVIDTVITSCEALFAIELELKRLKPDAEFAAKDMRIALTFFYRNSKQKSIILINEYNNIFLNDVLQNKNNRLIYLIKKNIGFYSWFTRGELKHMEELSDSSFVKDSVINTIENNPRLIGSKE